MAFVRMMGADSVAYHEATVLGRGDDHPGAALDYYGSRGETPLRWGGRGTRLLGLSGPVQSKDYKAIYGPGGAADPDTRIRLANTKRPGMELVVSAHKSVAELGVIGRADDMHAILDAERDATLDCLDRLMCERGGRRGRAATPTPTGGLVYAHTRHATTRAGDPGPHDHVLIANVSAMFDEHGGWKAANTAFIREHVHAATAVGRMAAAHKAIELGYGIVSDDGPSGRLRHWAIAGVPEQVMDLHSKRSDEIDDALDEAGFDSYRARGIAARTSRSAKRFEAVDDLVPRWRQELTDIGWRPHRLMASIRDADNRRIAAAVLDPAVVRAIVEHLLGPDGPLAALKVFSRRHVMVEAAPLLYGLDPGELDRVVDAVLDHGAAIPLVPRPGADEQPFAPACVLAIETAITRSIEGAAKRRGAPTASPDRVAAALDRNPSTTTRRSTPTARAHSLLDCTPFLASVDLPLNSWKAKQGTACATSPAQIRPTDQAGEPERRHRASARSNHWSATQAIAAGYDVQTVARRLGHADATTTLRVYSHAVDRSDPALAEDLGKIMRRANVEKPD